MSTLYFSSISLVNFGEKARSQLLNETLL